MKATKQQCALLSRLTQQAAFDSLRKTKIRWVAKGFAFQAIKDDGAAPTTHYCIITSKKAAAKATDRNRMRRRLRAVALQILADKAISGYSYMIVAKPDSLTLDMDTLRKDMQWCLKKLELLRDAPAQ